MGGGSQEPEGPDDHQCPNCGRWYARVGLRNHEPNCSHPDWADPLVPIRDVDEHPMMGGDTAEPARTDGGEGLGLEGPPERETVDEPSDGVDEEAETVNCPSCGSDLEATEDELLARFGGEPFGCGDCGTKIQVGA